MLPTLYEKLCDGETVRVMSLGSFPSPKLVEMIGLAGDVHGIWIDQEHAYVSHEQMELMLLACRATGLDAFARVPPADYATLMRPYETGCSGVMVAQIRTLDEVEQIVRWSHYPPRGVRGLFLGNAECEYGGVGAAAQVEKAAKRRWLAVQIETTEAIDMLDEIAACDGVDMLFVGPADLSSALGVPGQALHEKCRAALQKVGRACQAAGKPWGTLSRDPKHVEFCRDHGCRLFSIASDIDIVRRGIAATHDLFRGVVFP